MTDEISGNDPVDPEDDPAEELVDDYAEFADEQPEPDSRVIPDPPEDDAEELIDDYAEFADEQPEPDSRVIPDAPEDDR